MKARFLRFASVKSRARRASTLGLFLTLFASAAQAQGAPEQRRAGATELRRLYAAGDVNVGAVARSLRAVPLA